MDCRILDTYKNDLGIIEDYSSLVWTDRYDEAGDFEIVCPYSKEQQDDGWYEIGNFVVINVSEYAMIVENVEYSYDIESGATVTLSGASLEKILARRVGWVDMDFVSEESPVDVVKTLLISSFGLDPNEDHDENPRYLPSFYINNDSLTQVKAALSTEYAEEDLAIQGNYVGKSIYEAVTELCKSYGFGFSIKFDKNRNFIFSLMYGEDRSQTDRNTQNTYVVYAFTYDNLSSTTFNKNSEEDKNVALIGGEGEGIDRVFTSIYSSNTDNPPAGLDRKETFVDASGVSSKVEDAQGNTQYLEEEKYLDLLVAEGKDQLSSATQKTEVTTELGSPDIFVYGVDYFLGDIIQVIDAFGNSARLRVSEMCYSDDSSGYSMHPTTSALETDSGSAFTETTSEHRAPYETRTSQTKTLGMIDNDIYDPHTGIIANIDAIDDDINNQDTGIKASMAALNDDINAQDTGLKDRVNVIDSEINDGNTGIIKQISDINYEVDGVTKDTFLNQFALLNAVGKLKVIQYNGHTIYTTANSFESATSFFEFATIDGQLSLCLYTKPAGSSAYPSSPTTYFGANGTYADVVAANTILADKVVAGLLKSQNYIYSEFNPNSANGSVIDMSNGRFNFNGQVISDNDDLVLKKFKSIRSVEYGSAGNPDYSSDSENPFPVNPTTLGIPIRDVYYDVGRNFRGFSQYANDNSYFFVEYKWPQAERRPVPIIEVPKVYRLGLSTRGVGFFDTGSILSSEKTIPTKNSLNLNLDGGLISTSSCWRRIPPLVEDAVDAASSILTLDVAAMFGNAFPGVVGHNLHCTYATASGSAGSYTVRSGFRATARSDDAYTPTVFREVFPGDECVVSFTFDLTHSGNSNINEAIEVFVFYYNNVGDYDYVSAKNVYASVGESIDNPFDSNSIDSQFDDSYYVTKNDASTYLGGKFSYKFTVPSNIYKIGFRIDVNYNGDIVDIYNPCVSIRDVSRTDINANFLQLRSNAMTLWYDQDRPKVINYNDEYSLVYANEQPERNSIALLRDIYFFPEDVYVVAEHWTNQTAPNGDDYYITSCEFVRGNATNRAMLFSIPLPKKIHQSVTKVTPGKLDCYVRYNTGNVDGSTILASSGLTARFRQDSYVTVTVPIKSGYTFPSGLSAAGGAILQITNFSLTFSQTSS